MKSLVKKYAFILALPFKEISLQPKLSSLPVSETRGRGGGRSKRHRGEEGQTETLVFNIGLG